MTSLEEVIWGIGLVAVTMIIHYSLLQYTTVGSDLSLPDRWRLLGGMIAIAGVPAFAWSTAVLLVLAKRFQDEQLKRMSIEAPVDQQ